MPELWKLDISRMEPSHIVFGAITGFVGVMMLIGVFTATRSEPIAIRVGVAVFGINGLLMGVLHLGQGFGFLWATSELRARVFMWTIAPCLASWVWAWTIQQKESRKRLSFAMVHGDKRLLKPAMVAAILAVVLIGLFCLTFFT